MITIGNGGVFVSLNDRGENALESVISGLLVCPQSTVIHVAVRGVGLSLFVLGCSHYVESPSVATGGGCGAVSAPLGWRYPECDVVLVA